MSKRIVKTASTCNGQPRISGTRLTVELVLQDLAANIPDIWRTLYNYPALDIEAIKLVLSYAAKQVARVKPARRGRAQMPPIPEE